MYSKREGLQNNPHLTYNHHEEIHQIPFKKQLEGNMSAIKTQKEGRGSPFFPYSCDTEILKSCDIFTPLKISLLSVRSLAEKLKD